MFQVTPPWEEGSGVSVALQPIELSGFGPQGRAYRGGPGRDLLPHGDKGPCWVFKCKGLPEPGLRFYDPLF